MRTPTRLSLSLVAAAAVASVTCGRDVVEPNHSMPLLPPHAIMLRIDLESGTVRQIEPGAPQSAYWFRAALLGSNEIEATIANVARSSPVHGTVRVTFDLALTNQLENVDLVPSTFPAPPTGQVVAFPFDTDPAGLLGWKVVPNSDWDGGPWNFFNDKLCIGVAPPSDCYRWEAFGSSIDAGATTAAQRVGFDVDASISSFTVMVVVAADLRERPIPRQQPIIGVSDLDPIFTATQGGDAPASHAVQITNLGGGSLTGLSISTSYSAGATGWLAASLTSTTAPATLTLTVNPGTLPAATYFATVSVTSAAATNSPQQIKVAFVVSAPLNALSLSPNSLKIWAGYLGEAKSQTISVMSILPTPVTNMSVVVTYSGSGGWLQAPAPLAVTPATLLLVANPQTLPPGPYLATITVAAPGVLPVYASIEMDVVALPDLTFTGTPSVVTGPGTVSVSGLTVINQGYHDAGPFNVGICVSTTPSLGGCIAAQAFVTRTGLATGSSDPLPTLTITDSPITPLPAGNYYLFAVVDPPYTASVEESNENNNVLSLGAITITAPSADLGFFSPLGLTVSASAAATRPPSAIWRGALMR